MISDSSTPPTCVVALQAGRALRDDVCARERRSRLSFQKTAAEPDAGAAGQTGAVGPRDRQPS